MARRILEASRRLSAHATASRAARNVNLEVPDVDWNGKIVSTADTLWGKPRIAGTRIGVDFVLDLLASGWSEPQILENYPQLKADDLQAVFAFVRDCMKDESFIMRTKAESGPVSA